MAINTVPPGAPATPALSSDVAPEISLIQERFPKIGEKIVQLWGTAGLQEYLSKTIFDERGGRQGFPMPIVTALMRIYEYHGTLIPQVKVTDTWGPDL
jgi:hypothetical protein